MVYKCGHRGHERIKNGYGPEGSFQRPVLQSDLAIETIANPESVQSGRNKRCDVGRQSRMLEPVLDLKVTQYRHSRNEVGQDPFERARWFLALLLKP